VDPDLILRILEQTANGKAPGPNGWTEELLLDAASKSPLFLKSLCGMIHAIINGLVPHDVMELLLASRLIPIAKPDGSIRPIAIGDCLLKLAGRYVIRLHSKATKEFLEPFQFGFAERGVEQIVHNVRAAIKRHPDTVVAAVDFSNAFNSIFRKNIAHELYSNRELSPFWKMFAKCYCVPSSLFVHLPHSETVLQSTRGTRQGDALAAFFFFVGLQPLLRLIKQEFPELLVYAYMDDVTFIGHPSRVTNAVLKFRQLARAAGLEMNKKKTEVYSPNQQYAFDVAAACEITPKTDGGIKVLGAWVTCDPHTTHAFLMSRLRKHQDFFNNIIQLKPQYALPILQCCGIPRWNFLARTHSPDEATAATKEFDDTVLRTLGTILNIDTTTLSRIQQRVISVPMRFGGLGITAYTPLLSEIYAASLDPTSNSQTVRTEAYIKEILKEIKLDEAWSSHLTSCSKRNTGIWLAPKIRTRIRGCDFQNAAQHRLLCSGVHPRPIKGCARGEPFRLQHGQRN